MLCVRRHSDKNAGNQLYKSFMIHFQADLVEQCLDDFASDQIHVMVAKLSRRVLKLHIVEDGRKQVASTQWASSVQDIMTRAYKRLKKHGPSA
jgi:hypothetical protein